MTPTDELAHKVGLVREHLSRHGLSVAFFAGRAGFAWLTGGGRNQVNHASEAGVGVLAISAGEVALLCNAIEAPRFADEEVGRLGIPVREFPWYDAAARLRVFEELVAGGRPCSDVPVAGVTTEGDRRLAALRYELLPVECERYRDGGRRVGMAIGEAAMEVAPGMTEFEAAASIHRHMLEADCFPWVTLVAADDRISRYRHPVPREQVMIRRTVMLVCCAEYRGLITAVTRIVRFGMMDDDLRRRHDAVGRVDAALIAGTRPGRTLSDVFADGRIAYAAAGFADEWTRHHQGGPCGYLPRDFIATPTSSETVGAGQAFAWNPSIAGTKSEDTLLAAAEGAEILSATPNWPMFEVPSPAGPMKRPDILLR